jgi:spore germination cell wall hydrolase CwlJ-like protein
MMKPGGKAYRADGALVGAGFVVIAGVAASIAVNHYTDRLESRVPAPKIAESLTQAEVAGAQLAAQSECLAEVMYYEARGEGVEGEKAVAEVVLQRTRNPNYPRTVCGVVYEGVVAGRKTGCQFSFACDGSVRRPRDMTVWPHVRLLAEKIMAGQVRLGGETGNAIAFHTIDVSPVWAGTMLKTTQIGRHVFYRFMPREALRQPVSATAPQASAEVQPQVQVSGAVGQGA